MSLSIIKLLESIGPINEPMDEVVTHGKTMMAYIPPALLDDIASALVKAGAASDAESARSMLRDDSGILSLMGSDAYNSIIQKYLEKYDKDMDEAILRSENIVKAYNDFINCEFDKAAITAREKLMNSDTLNAIEMMAAAYEQYVSIGVNEGMMRKYCIDNAFFTSDNPDEIKRMLKMRINYSNTMIKLFQAMLNENYTLLGFSKDEALLLSQQLVSKDQDERQMSIKAMKDALMQNKAKFDKGRGFIDLRPLGGGVFFGTVEETGLDKFINIESMLQTSLRYDCIVFGHGDTVKSDFVKEYQKFVENKYEMLKKRSEQMDEQYNKDKEKFKKQLDAIIDKIETNDEYKRHADNISRMSNNTSKQYNDMVDHFNTRYTRINKQLSVEYGKLMDIMADPDPNVRKRAEKIKKRLDELDARAEKLKSIYEKAISKSIEQFNVADEEAFAAAYKKFKQTDHMKSVDEQIENIYDDLNKMSEEFTAKYVEQQRKPGESTKGRRWVIQPVYTEKAGPFVDMNDLVRQCIKEGHKSICVVACNPGHHKLDPDLYNMKGVHIHHATNTLLAESTLAPMFGTEYNMFDPIDEAMQNIYEAECGLVQFCNESGINYHMLDSIIDESVIDFDMEPLTEASAKEIWGKIVALVKRAITFVVRIFKRIIDFFKGILDKIKNFFERVFKNGKIEKPLRKSFRTKFVMVENASIKSVQINSWDDLQKEVMNACTKISNKIKQEQAKQSKWLSEAQRYTEKMEKSNPQNENVYDLRALRALLYS